MQCQVGEEKESEGERGGTWGAVILIQIENALDLPVITLNWDICLCLFCPAMPALGRLNSSRHQAVQEQKLFKPSYEKWLGAEVFARSFASTLLSVGHIILLPPASMEYWNNCPLRRALQPLAFKGNCKYAPLVIWHRLPLLLLKRNDVKAQGAKIHLRYL